jgi:uncharacterized protein (TIGR03086 family)
MSISSPPRPVAVLDSAVTWTADCLQLARTSPLDVPTPCADWDLGQLLVHMEDSLVALEEAAEQGHVRDAVLHSGKGPSVDRVIRLGCGMRAAWHARLTSAPIGISDLRLGRDTTVLVGALEVAVHGWDVARATGQDRRIPEDLAVRLYDVALAVVTPEERGTRFAPVVEVPPSAPRSTRLLAHLGRRDD